MRAALPLDAGVAGQAEAGAGALDSGPAPQAARGEAAPGAPAPQGAMPAAAGFVAEELTSSGSLAPGQSAWSADFPPAAPLPLEQALSLGTGAAQGETLALESALAGQRLSGVAELSVIVPCFNERDNVAELVRRLDAALRGVAWEAVFVDDDSPDGTAAAVRRIAACDPRIRCIRRIGRRGLSSAVIEGVLSCSSTFVAVMDGDLQHDESRLPDMLALMRGGEADLVVASRFAEGGDAAGLAGARRLALSNTGIRIATALLGRELTDPMSGFFMMPRAQFEALAPRLSGQGFKILLDLLLSAPAARVKEVGAHFRARHAGESKLSPQVMVQFFAVLLDKACGGVIPLRFFSFALVGAFGVLVHLAVLITADSLNAPFVYAQTAATLTAMMANFELNNRITYRDKRLRGGRLWRGRILFMLVCGVGALANIGIASAFYASGHAGRTPAGALGAVIGVVWNYAMSATLVWGRNATQWGKRRRHAA